MFKMRRNPHSTLNPPRLFKVNARIFLCRLGLYVYTPFSWNCALLMLNRFRFRCRRCLIHSSRSFEYVISPLSVNILMRAIQENRLAQVATVDQQRELMRYMADLNNWLARDVRDRQAEIRGVNARIENLRREIGMMAAPRGKPPPFPHFSVPADTFSTGPSTVASSSESGSPMTFTIPGGVAPTFPQPNPYVHGPTPYISGHQQMPMHPGTGPVHPPVIPPDVTPSPGFRPVIPGVQPQQHGATVVLPGGGSNPRGWLSSSTFTSSHSSKNCLTAIGPIYSAWCIAGI